MGWSGGSSAASVGQVPGDRRPRCSGSPTVITIITVPSALISGEIELRSIEKICVGTVSTPPGFQKSVPVMSSKLMVKAKSAPAATAGISSGSVTAKKVWRGEAPRLSAASSTSRRIDDQPRLHDEDHEGQGEDDMAHQEQARSSC